MTEEAGPRKRSPRSPASGLKEALARALVIYEKEGRHPVPSEVAAQDLGYKDYSSGASRTAIATLRQFGLVIQPKEAYVAVARQVETYKFAPDERTKQAALIEFAKTPTTYRLLINKFPDRLPSDAALRFELIEMGFLPATVDDEVKHFKETMEFAAIYAGHGGLGDESEEMPSGDSPRPASANAIPPPAVQPMQGTADRIPIRLSGGRRAVLEIPTPFYDSDKQIIKAQIDLVFTDDRASALAREESSSS